MACLEADWSHFIFPALQFWNKADRMKNKPGGSPAIIRQKKPATIDSTELEKFQEELKTGQKHRSSRTTKDRYPKRLTYSLRG